MKFKYLRIIFANLMLFSTCLFNIANANIIEIDIFNDGTNRGFALENGNLEWMDFGVNNHILVADVLTNLQIGGQFEDWRLPTESEILNFWYEAVFVDFQNLWQNDANQSVIYADTIHAYIHTITQEEFDPLYWRIVALAEFMGWNTPYGNGHGSAEGAYLTDDGRLLSTSFGVQSQTANVGISYLQADFYDYDVQYSTDIGLSTMLVRSRTVGVPEPSTTVIFALGLMGLILRRFKKQ
jgi:hypothetical protein